MSPPVWYNLDVGSGGTRVEDLFRPAEKEQYLQGWRERARGRAVALEQTRKDALAKASAAARLAREQYGIRRAVLFGSLAIGAFAEGSDVDLCVEGLGDQSLYYPLYGDMERLVRPLRLHLVLREDLSASGSDRDLLQEIETRGVELT